jgi:hypothetical protein
LGPTAEQIWKEIAGDIYAGNRWRESEAPDSVISDYSFMNWHEDISELTAAVYTTPGYVQWRAASSPVLRQKLAFLMRLQYISPSQYCSATTDIRKSFTAEWKEVAGDVSNLKDSGKLWLTTAEADARGLINGRAAESMDSDIAVTRNEINESPGDVRAIVRQSPILAEKIDLLYRFEFITDAQYRYVMSLDGDDISARPENDPLPCALITDTLLDGAECYLGRGMLETEPMMGSAIDAFATGFSASSGTPMQLY